MDLKAKRKARTFNKLKRVPSTQLEAESREELLEEERLFNEFAVKMKPHLPEMHVDQRDALLTKLYRMSNANKVIEWYLAAERGDVRKNVQRFRQYRLWLVSVDRKLSEAMKAMYKAMAAANRYPKPDMQNDLESFIVRQSLVAVDRAGNELGKVIKLVGRIQYDLAAGIHPRKRSPAEKKLVKQELGGLEHTKLPLSENTTKIDHWLGRQASDVLDKYRQKDGRPIRKHGQIIEKVFDFQYGAAGGIQKELQPSRRKKSRQLV
jgi:hypothetical protein